MALTPYETRLVVNYDNVNTYCTSPNDILHKKSSAPVGSAENVAYEMYMDGGTGTVILNDAAEAVLFPSPQAKPNYLYTYFRGFRASIAWNNTTNTLKCNDTELFSASLTKGQKTEHSSGNLVNNTITNMNAKNSQLSWQIKVGSQEAVSWISNFEIKMAFNRYSIKYDTTKDARGVASVWVETTNPKETEGAGSNERIAFRGDTVTYKVSLNNRAIWKGWYADKEHTKLISKALDYTFEASEDYILYAYAVQPQGLSYKLNNTWKEGIVLWIRDNSQETGWREISKENFQEILKTTFYQFKGEIQQNE